MWTRFCLRVLSASFFLKPLTEASSWRNTPLANSSTWTGPFSSQEAAASGSRGSVAWWTSEVGEYTSAHQSTRVSTSRWLSPSDAPTDSWIGGSQHGQAVDSVTATAVCSSGSGDTDTAPWPLSTISQPIATALPPASQSESATPSSSTNQRPEILTETAAQEEGPAAASVSPALSIIPADPSITLQSGFSRPASAATPLHYTLPNQPPPASSARHSAPTISPVTPGGPSFTPSVLNSLFPSVNSSIIATSSSSVPTFLPPAPSLKQSPPQTPAPLSIASTATPSPSRFASASVVKSAAEASSADGSDLSTSLIAPTTFSFPPHASAFSPTRPGYGVATPPKNFSASSTSSNLTFAATTTLVIFPSMALSFYTDSTSTPSFPAAFPSGASPSGPPNPSVPTLTASMPDNTNLPISSSGSFSPDSNSIFTCGGNPFRPSEYTCFDDSTLCPVQDGGRLEACGGSCYNPALYGCVDNGLQPIVSGTLPGGATPTRTIPVPVTQWPSGVSTPSLSTASGQTASLGSSSFSILSTSTTSSNSSPSVSRSSSSRPSSTSSSLLSFSTASSSSSSPTSSSSASSPASTSASASSSSTAAPAASNDSLSSNQIAAIAASTSAAVVLFVIAGIILFRRYQRKHPRAATQPVYPEIAYLYDPPVPGSGQGSRTALGGVNSSPGGGPVGPFGVGGVGGAGGAQSAGVSGGVRGGAGSPGTGNAATWTGATLGALGATLRGGGRSTSPHSSSSNGSAVSLVGPAGRPPVMGASGANGSNGSGSGSSNAALLAGRSGQGTPTRGNGDGNTLAPAPSRSDEGAGDETRPFLVAGGTAPSSEAPSRDRSVERGEEAVQGQQFGRNGDGLWDEIDRDSGERLHEQQVEETRQRRELARAFLLQAKERQEQRIPLINRSGGESSSSGAGAATAIGIGGAALAGAAAVAASRGQQRQDDPPAQHTQQQWWQPSPTSSPPPGPHSPPAVALANTYTPAYHPIYPPTSSNFPPSGPILTSQHIEQNRREQAQHAHAARAASPTYPSFHRPSPSYPPPNWPQAQQNTYHTLNNSSNGSASSVYSNHNNGVSNYPSGPFGNGPFGGGSVGSSSFYSSGVPSGNRPFFHQNTSYNPPPRSYSHPNPNSNGTSSFSAPSLSVYSRDSHGNAMRRGSAGSIYSSNNLYTTIPEEEMPPVPPLRYQQQQDPQSLHQIMHQMNALDEEDSGDEGQGFLQAPRRVLSVRNGAVTPSTDGDESPDERDGGVRRRVGEDVGRNLL